MDSIVVNRSVRLQGIAMMTVTKLFTDWIEDAVPDIDTIVSHAVHPATVRMLTSQGSVRRRAPARLSSAAKSRTKAKRNT